MSAAFTPGPWTLTQHAKFADTQMYWVNSETSVGTAVEADALLIAAAPDLYEALLGVGHALDLLDTHDSTMCGDALNARTAALAKARGQ